MFLLSGNTALGTIRAKLRCFSNHSSPDTRSPHTVNSELTTLSGIFHLAAWHRFVRENPCGKVKQI